jgi:hypothetical protein
MTVLMEIRRISPMLARTNIIALAAACLLARRDPEGSALVVFFAT